MCGRYTLFRFNKLWEDFPNLQLPSDLLPHFNIAPTQSVLAIPNNHPNQLKVFHWGLIPSWAKDPSIGNRMINARAETLAEKPAFKAALRRRRCLVPADGFYEWHNEGRGKKTPLYIRPRSAGIFAFAGLWEHWQSPNGSVLPSVTIVTTTPNALMKSIHDRMPAIVQPKDYARWLNPAEVIPGEVADVLQPYPAEEMEAFPVSPRVNKPGHDAENCIERVESQTLF